MIVEDLYRQVIDAWNRRDADAFAALFILDGEAVGFDGTQHTRRGTIHEQVRAIFASQPTPPYVRAVAGMVPPGRTELDPTAVRRAGST